MRERATEVSALREVQHLEQPVHEEATSALGASGGIGHLEHPRHEAWNAGIFHVKPATLFLSTVQCIRDAKRARDDWPAARIHHAALWARAARLGAIDGEGEKIAVAAETGAEMRAQGWELVAILE